MRPPLTKNKYGTIDKSIPVTTADKTKTNATGYALKQVPKKVKGKDWLDTVDDVMSAPQKAATYAVEAGLYKAGVRKDPPKYESPSDALNISEKDSPWIKMGVDMLLDPTNLLGIGIGKKIVSGYKDLKYLDKTDNVVKPLTKIEDGFKINSGSWVEHGDDIYFDSDRINYEHIKDIDIGDQTYEVIKNNKKYKNLNHWKYTDNNLHYPRMENSEYLATLYDILLPADKIVRKGQKAGVAIALTNDLINQQPDTQQPNKSTSTPVSTPITKTAEVKKQTINKNTPKTNFEQRIQNPIKQINNSDGTSSTHKMMSFEADGKYYAAPTIVQKGDSLVELSQKDAIDYAFKNKELKEFKTEKESQDYAKGGYKVNTPLEQPKKDTGKPDTYWLGDRWGSYDDLIQSNPRMKDPNLFYNTYKRKAPIDSTGTKTNLVIPKYKEGGLIKKYKQGGPIEVTDPKDPALLAYKDSLDTYNESLYNIRQYANADPKWNFTKAYSPTYPKHKTPAWAGYPKNMQPTGFIKYSTKVKQNANNTIGPYPYWYTKGDGVINTKSDDKLSEEDYVPIYKKPVNQIIYKKPNVVTKPTKSIPVVTTPKDKNSVSKMTPIELSSLPNNTTSEPQKRVVEPIKTVNKGYMDMRGQWLDNPATSFDYTPEQLEKMGYRKSIPKMKLGGEVPKYREGGLIKRADGSYSERGLWDNIRANRGSGKEPTPEMLEQERKIKKYKQGGEIKNSWLDTYEDGGPVTENQIQPQPLDSTTYENNIKNNYTSFLKNNPSVTLPKTVQNGDGMNCINGVCNLINASSGLELKGGQYATKVGKGKSYVGNASFNDASEKEGFYKLTNDDLNRDGFKPGDVVQYSKYKLNANRFDGKVNSNNAFDLYPQHAKIIVDKYKKGADTYYKIVDNGGEESYRINEISEKDLMSHNKNGYNAGLGHNYAGLIVQRYNPNEVLNRQNIEKSKKDIIKGINPHSKEYDTAVLPNYKFNTDSDNQGGKLGNELMTIYNKNYKQIGKSSNLSPDILNKLMINQVGIAGQETKYGSDLGFVKNLIPDSMLDEARQLKRNFNNEDSWTKDYYQKHSNKPEFVKKYPSLSKFQNEISDKYGDTSGKDNYLYLHGARSKGVFQQKELSERGNYLVKDKNLSNLESQAVGSLALAVDNYHKLAAKYPNLKPDQLIDLVTLSHNAPGKAMIPEYVEYYLKNNDIDYVNKVKKLIPAIENNSSKQKINTSNNLLSNR